MFSSRHVFTKVTFALVFFAALCASTHAQGQAAPAIDVNQKLAGFDAFMEKTLKDWNAPGIGVGIVVGDKLVFAKGYGYRDYEKKLPVTAQTMYTIASNTKLFTAVAAGMLVEEGKLTWDRPIKESVPTIEFYNSYLNNTITLRDMLSHRTGITRHDSIWYKSDYSTKELFERLKYLEPKESPRQIFLYNNMMYAGAGDRFAECRWSNAWLVGSSKSGLWHGALDGIIPRSLDRVSWRRPARLSFADFIHAERAHRRDRVRDWQSHRTALQPDQLQRL